MIVESGRVKGDREIAEELALLGTLTGDAVVKAGGVLHVHGILDGDLVVEIGGRAYVRGMVSGDAHNRGGLLIVRGIVVGLVRRAGGETVVHPKAAVHKGVL